MRKGENESSERVLAMDSSSIVAIDKVSRSESLLRQVITRVLTSEEEEDSLEVDIVGEMAGRKKRCHENAGEVVEEWAAVKW